MKLQSLRSETPASLVTSQDRDPVSAGKMNGWRSIKSAPRKPRDNLGYGPRIMLFVCGQIGFGYWDYDFDRFYVEHPECMHEQPTHWRPLPKPPR